MVLTKSDEEHAQLDNEIDQEKIDPIVEGKVILS